MCMKISGLGAIAASQRAKALIDVLPHLPQCLHVYAICLFPVLLSCVVQKSMSKARGLTRVKTAYEILKSTGSHLDVWISLWISGFRLDFTQISGFRPDSFLDFWISSGFFLDFTYDF